MARDHAHGAHRHESGSPADLPYLLTALGLIAAFMAAEVVAALVAGSLALFADAGHMLVDVGALAASAWAARLAARPPAGVWTFGLKRAEILSAAVNGVTLVVIAVLIAVEAALRLARPGPVAGSVVLAVALAGVAVNLIATLVLSRAERSSLNVRGAFAHIVTDLYAFAGTALAGALILAFGWRRADAAASLAVAGLMVHAAWGLLRDAGRVLLQAAPEGVDLAALRRHLLDTEHVLEVHDLHVWTVTSGLPTLSAHVVIEDHCFASGHAPRVLDALQDCIAGHFDVAHSTLQLEPAGHARHEGGAHP